MGTRNRAHCSFYGSYFILLVGLLYPPLAWSIYWPEFYLAPPSQCSVGAQSEQRPTVPLRFLSETAQDQGKTGTCGFHAGTLLLEALVNSERSEKETASGNVSLSVVDAIRQSGYCTKEEIENAKTNTVPFFLKMRRIDNLKIDFHSRTVKQYVEELCISPSTPVLSSSAVKSLESLNQVTSSFSIPPYNIETWDILGSEVPEEECDKLFKYFNSPKALPLGFSICVEEDERVSEGCKTSHGTVLVGVKKQTCSDGKAFYTGIFKDSFGDNQPIEYDLTKLLTGMIRHKLGYFSLQRCGNENECLDPPILSKGRGSFLFHHLVYAGDIAGLEKLSKSVDLDQVGPYNYTPLHIAAFLGRVEEINALSKFGADLNRKTPNGFTPLCVAAERGQVAAVKALLEKGADPNLASEGGYTPLYFAAERGQVAAVMALLEKGADPNRALPLFVAAEKKHLDVVKALLEYKPLNDKHKKVDPNIMRHGTTLLFFAASNKHWDVVSMLLDVECLSEHSPPGGLTIESMIHNSGNEEIIKKYDEFKSKAKGGQVSEKCAKP